MRVSIIQTDIIWADIAANLVHFEQLIQTLKGKTDLVVLPEMCTTGFCVSQLELAETTEGTAMQAFRKLAVLNETAIVGSFLCTEDEKYYNRAFFCYPNGKVEYYDKRHLFRMGEEHEKLTPGEQAIIVNYLDWNICINICYDLRFPVWSRNINNAYDLLIYVANWPTKRIKEWDTLLKARAIENQSFSIGCNRVRTDKLGVYYNGHSQVNDPIGRTIKALAEDDEGVLQITLEKKEITRLREHFPVWRDADVFRIDS